MGDPEELLAIDEIFCTGRSGPLKIGSIKSNLGHSEPASGLCSVAKVQIPNNLNKKKKQLSTGYYKASS